MLILTRKPGEKIRIGKNIVISVVENSHNQIKVGIDAPINIPVHREEIYNLIQNENQAALVTRQFENEALGSFLRRYK